MNRRTLLLLLALATPATAVHAAEATGQVDWAQKAVLSTPVSGTVAEVRAAPGQRAKRGALLLRLDERRLQAELAGAEADVKRLKLAMEEAQREFERATELYDRTVIARRDLDLAEIEAAMAQAQFARAEATVTRIRVDLEDSRIRAPFDGIVSAVHVTPGEAVSNELSATPMIEMVGDRLFHARAWVAEGELAGFVADAPAQIEVGGQTFTGRVLSVGLNSRGEGDAQRFEVLAEFESGGAALRAGMPARIRTR
jgi:multidrug efflux system membrane fusion protein